MKEIEVYIGDLLLKAVLLRQVGNQGIIYCQDRIVTATFDRTAKFWHSDYAQTVLLDLCDVNLQNEYEINSFEVEHC